MAAVLALLTALPAFIQSLPYLCQVLLRLMGVLESFISWARQNNLNGWLDDIEKTFDDLRKADTPEKKREAAGSLVDLVRKLT